MKLDLDVPHENLKWMMTSIIRTSNAVLVDPVLSSKIIVVYNEMEDKLDIYQIELKDRYEAVKKHYQLLKELTWDYNT